MPSTYTHTNDGLTAKHVNYSQLSVIAVQTTEQKRKLSWKYFVLNSFTSIEFNFNQIIRKYFAIKELKLIETILIGDKING